MVGEEQGLSLVVRNNSLKMQKKKETLKKNLLLVLCYLTMDKMIKMNMLTKDHMIGAHDSFDINKKNILEN